jgi:hypothetical protein
MPDVAPPAAPPRPLKPTAALLSYLVPGLGQISQGRIGKGVLFMVCLLGLFFYGMYLGSWRNVYIEDSEPTPGNKGARVNLIDAVVAKARFFGQFWIGVAAWPAILQYASAPPAGAPPADHPVFGKFQNRPTEPELNEMLRNSGKGPDLGWTYTVIAGVLNILVIYDALAGPAFGFAARATPPAPRPATAASDNITR